jgi:transcriptional regulator with XRE-family HTH domain
MQLSERIKQARLEMGLSQRQLCGQTITRNMLSLIESGKARPSMDTLAYFAKVLGKPMGYFLEEQAVTSPNQQVMEQAEKH